MLTETILPELAVAQARLDTTRHRPGPISGHWLGRKQCDHCDQVWRFWFSPWGRGCREYRALALDLEAKKRAATVWGAPTAVAPDPIIPAPAPKRRPHPRPHPTRNGAAVGRARVVVMAS